MTTTDQSRTGTRVHTRLFTIREVAGIAGVSIMTVRRWIEDHGLQVHRLGRLVRISQADLDAFFDTKRHNDISVLPSNSE